MTKLTKALLMASFAGTYAETMLTPLYAGFTQKIGGTVMDAGAGYAVLHTITGAVVIVTGRTKFFQKHLNSMVFFGFLIAGVCDMLYLFVSNRAEFFAVQVCLGIAVGLLNPAWDALYSDDDAEGESGGKRWSFWTGGVSFIEGMSALTGGAIVFFLGFKPLFVIMAVADCLAIYYAWNVRKLANQNEAAAG